jgi:glutathione S-transferase
MDYKSPKEAQDLPGLRLALTAGLPAPWSMAARFMFDVKKIPYVPVLQQGGGANEDLITWTGHRNAPVAMYDDEPARTNWADIIELSERLQPEPRLVPEDIDDRMLMFGLANEICGAGGMTYNSRHSMVANFLKSGVEGLIQVGERMGKAYGYSPEAAAKSEVRISNVLKVLATQLERQRKRGSRYFVGDNLCALDLIWASFSNTIRPLPADVNPMDDGMRASYSRLGDRFAPADILFEHRDFIYNEHLTLPLDF